MLELKIKGYSEELQGKWDDFVMTGSLNGTFLQTRNFLNYHGSRYKDASLLLYKGIDTIVAVVPACVTADGHKKIYNAHAGSTFGGIVIGNQFNDIEHVESIMNALEVFFRANGYDEVRLRCTSEIFAKGNTELLQYFLYQKGYSVYEELSSYIDFNHYNEDIITNFSSGRRRDYKYALKYGMELRKIHTREGIKDFYQLLCDNLEKYNTKPVHTFEELVEFKEKRLTDIVEFYGVYIQDRMIAGSMVFRFENRVFHTQYLAADQRCLKLYPMNFLDERLISLAKEEGFRYFSFGISTEEKGKVLNKSLAQFKAGFGTQFGINRTYVKMY